jgi:N-acetylneuraminic acid mutarotase
MQTVLLALLLAAAEWAFGVGCGSRTGLGLLESATSAEGGTSGDDAGGDAAPATGAVLFGGAGRDSVLSDTWRWDGAGWTQLQVTGPPARFAAVMAPLDGKLVLFGGDDDATASGSVPDLSDTWIWDGTAWTELDVTGPAGRDGAVMAPLDGKLVLYGGQAGTGCFFFDTWTWDGTAWTQLDVTGPVVLSASMAPLDHKLVLFGQNNIGGENVAETWTWDGSVWARIDAVGPSARDDAAMAPLGNALILFGGGFESPDFSDTWSWGGTAWTQIQVSGPAARWQAVLAPRDDELVLFGGEDAEGNDLSDTWTWNGAEWTQANVTGPSARRLAVMASP